MEDTFSDTEPLEGSPFKRGNSHKKAIRELGQETGERVKQMAQDVSVKAQQLRQSASKKAQDFKKAAEEQVSHGKERARDIHKDTEAYIREHPTRAVLTALGVGFIIGLVIRR